MSLLIHSHSDVDNSNSSYYGATGLYIMRYALLFHYVIFLMQNGILHRAGAAAKSPVLLSKVKKVRFTTSSGLLLATSDS